MKIQPIEAAGGVVYRLTESADIPEVLLIYRNKIWDLPKGKLELGESIPMCAAREVSEETGTEIPVIISDLGTTYHKYEQKGALFGKTTYWYSMVFPGTQSLLPQKEEGIEKVEWVNLDEAVDRVGFENLKSILSRFSEFFCK